jgi:hypothetical protein
MYSALRSEERIEVRGQGLLQTSIEPRFDLSSTQERPLTPTLSSLLKAEYIHVLSLRAPMGRGRKHHA